MRLSLVRAPQSPDPQADQGAHRFTYALLPGVDIAQTVAQAYELNLPLRLRVGRDTIAPPLVNVAGPAVVVESVKLADDRSGDVVVRLYEALGARVTTTVRLGFTATRADAVDLLERRIGAAELAGREVAITLRPFQILTLRFARGQ